MVLKEIVGFPGYFASDCGRIWSVHMWRGQTGRRLSPATSSKNDLHLHVILCGPEGHVSRTVHRLVLETFSGTCPPGKIACHRNGDARDNRLSNLYWGSYKENVADSVRHRTAVHLGWMDSYHPCRTHTESVVLAIDHALQKEHKRQCDIARQYGVTKDFVFHIARRDRWSYLWRRAKGEPEPQAQSK